MPPKTRKVAVMGYRSVGEWLLALKVVKIITIAYHWNYWPLCLIAILWLGAHECGANGL